MEYLEKWKNLLEDHISSMKIYLDSLKQLSENYQLAKKDVSDIGFNVFTLMSDFYYRENFHSDIIAAFLNPFGEHKQGNLYLNLFVTMLGLNSKDYEFSEVKREEHRIDILIRNEKSKKAIIIENKMNNAIDMDQQIPRYYREMASKDYDIEKIVYIPLDISKKPDTSTWEFNEKKEINEKLEIIPAYNRDNTKINLVDNWVYPSIINSNDLESSLILRQYGKLIKYLNTSAMDTISLSKFYDSIKEENNLETAISIRNMLNELPEYLAIRIENKFSQCYFPFEKIWIYIKNTTVFEGFKVNELYFKINILCNENGYDVIFFEKDDKIDICNYFNKIKELEDFKIYNGNISQIHKQFGIFKEDVLFEFIRSLCKSLTEFRQKELS